MTKKLVKLYIRFKEPIEFVIRVFRKSDQDDASAYAAQSAFFILMSAFPFAMLLLQLMKFAPVSSESLLFAVDSIFPEYLLPTIHAILQEIYSSTFSGVTVTVITALWASSKATHAVLQGLGHICNEDKVSNWFIIRARALLFTLLVAVILVLAVTMIYLWQEARSLLIQFRPRGIPLHIYYVLIRSIYTIVLVTIALAVIYKAFPRKKLKFLGQLPGAFAATLGIFGFSTFVAIYISEFNGFSMYGSLTTLTLVMFWLYFCNYFIMIGAEINEVIRRDKEKAEALKAIGLRG
ncbi:MAG: YihY/virulence factor BrkB family protein [Lachnospiraceae bacterium]|nr:YihY/virulence factor BrkB family protein [Lachnospiraceae bacterium]